MLSALKSRLLLFIFSTLLLTFPFVSWPQQANAQTVATTTKSFNAPNTDPDVPRNLHTYSQSALIDILSAIACQLGGIDPSNPSQPCLSVNPQTHKIGYAPQTGNNQLGGVIGVLTDQIGLLYIPPASSDQYVSYLADNFGIVKTAQAATPKDGVGFNGLQPIFKLWKTTLNLAYFLLVLVFIFIGVAVMLRIKIDPRTVMTVQNQIPRVVICILLITFSYAIAGFMIDIMWTVTYVGINAVASGDNDVDLPCGSGQNNTTKLSERATTHLIDTPISYFNTVFHSKADKDVKCGSFENGFSGGIFHVTQSVSHALGGIVRDVVTQLLGSKGCNPVQAGLQVATLGLFGTGAVKNCAGSILASTFGFLANVISWLIILCAILISLFRVWFALIKAYIHILFYVIAAPIWIAMGLIPGRPLGFENWMRNMFVNLAVFPLTAILFVAARVFMEAFQNADVDPNKTFIPPLVGNPNIGVFGTLLAFGVVLMAPGVLDILKEKMKAQGVKQGGQLIGNALTVGTGVATAIPKRQWASMTSRDQQGRSLGSVAAIRDAGTKKIVSTFMTRRDPTTGKAKGGIPFISKLADKSMEKRENQEFGFGRVTNKQKEERYSAWKTTEDKQAPPPGRPETPKPEGGKPAHGGQGTEDRTQQTIQATSQRQEPQAHEPHAPTGTARDIAQGPQGQQSPATRTLGDIKEQARDNQPHQGTEKAREPHAPTGTARDIAQGPQGQQSPATRTLGDIKEQARDNQPSGNQPSGGTKSVGTLNVGTLNVKNLQQAEGGHGAPQVEAPKIQGVTSRITEALKEGAKTDMQPNISPAADVKTPEVTDVGQEATRNEVKTNAMGAAFAERMAKLQEHGGEAESTTQEEMPTTQIKRDVHTTTTHTSEEKGESPVASPAEHPIQSPAAKTLGDIKEQARDNQPHQGESHKENAPKGHGDKNK